MNALATALILFAAPADVPITRLASLPPVSEAREVLGGHLVLQVPPRAAEIAASRTDDTRLAIDAGEERLEIHASELFALAGDDFAGAVARTVQGWGGAAATHRITPAETTSGLVAVEVVPQQPDLKPTGAFVRGVFVASPDGTVQYLEARANAHAARDFAAADALATRVLRTVSAGTRGLPSGPAPVRLVTPNPAVTMFAASPRGMTASVQREKDRVVHRFQPLAPLGENAPSLTITFAKDARYLHDRLARQILPVTRDGKLFGQKAFWHAWSAKDGKQHLEAIVSLPGTTSAPLNAHVLILHRTDEHADALRALAESMSMEQRPD